jgi:acetyl-CoA synthetase
MALRTEAVIRPAPEALEAANVPDPAALAGTFSWADARAMVDGLPGGGLNICHEAVDRHAAGPRADHVALRFLPRRGEPLDLTYADLAEATNRYASALDALGLPAGSRIFHLLGRVPELYVAVLGALKHGSVACTLFSAFGPEPIRQRMVIGEAAVIVTSPQLYDKKIAAIRDQIPTLRYVLVTGPPDQVPEGDGVLSLQALLDAADSSPRVMHTDDETPSLLHFTSGTTGTPKGAVHVHGAVVAHAATGWAALDLHPDDVFWCTADPGWVTGTSYGIIAPLVLGVTSVVDEADLDPERWYRILDEQRVTVWYTAPTAIRMLMKVGVEAAAGCDLSRVRFAASVGEPLNPEAVRWGREQLGLLFHDGWWQTETGGIMVANLAATPVRPGSMGRPLPGIDGCAARVRRRGRTGAARRSAVRARRRRHAGRAGAAGTVAVDVPRLPRPARAVREVLRGRLVRLGRRRTP